jgi:hypothetical protein
MVHHKLLFKIIIFLMIVALFKCKISRVSYFLWLKKMIWLTVDMTIKLIPAGTRGYPLKPYPLWRGKPELTEFEFGFGFFPISKDGVGAGNEDIDTVPEPAPHILKLDFTFFKLEILKNFLNYIYIFIFYLKFEY